MSHEIRTPLNVVLMGLNLLQENTVAVAETAEGFQREEAEATLDLIADMKGSTTMAVDILNDLLTYEKVDSNLLALEKQDTSMYDIIKTALLVFKAQARGVGVAFSWDLEQSVGVICAVDGSKIGQVLRNLMSNAIKFTPSGGRVLVATQIVPAAAPFELTEAMIECLTAPIAPMSRPPSAGPSSKSFGGSQNQAIGYTPSRKVPQSIKHRSPFIIEETGSDAHSEVSDDVISEKLRQGSYSARGDNPTVDSSKAPSTSGRDNNGTAADTQVAAAGATSVSDDSENWPQLTGAKPKPSPSSSGSISGFVSRLFARCTGSPARAAKPVPTPESAPVAAPTPVSAPVAADPVSSDAKAEQSGSQAPEAPSEETPQATIVSPVAVRPPLASVTAPSAFASNPTVRTLSSKGHGRTASFDTSMSAVSNDVAASAKFVPVSDTPSAFDSLPYERMLRISVTDTGKGIAAVCVFVLFYVLLHLPFQCH